MRRIVVAPDSFKESLEAGEVASAVARGVRKVVPEAEVMEIPLSDGGEGLVSALVKATGGQVLSSTVTGPLGRRVTARWGILGDGTTAVIEMAQASGLALVPQDRRNPLITTTYGTGELVCRALDAGCRKIIIGIGGSATHDGGAGMAQALGAKLLGPDDLEIGPGASGLERLSRIDTRGMDGRLKDTEIVVACDVDNPLCGPRGAAYTYALQKGASPDMLPRLDAALDHYARIVARDLGRDVRDIPGSGAAGGLGAGLMAFLGGKLRRGIELVMDIVGLENAVRGADLVITGEGEINNQTSYGKVPVGVARIAGIYGVPVVALVGSIGEGAHTVYEQGINAIMSIVPGPRPLSYCLENAAFLLEEAAERLMRLILVGRTGGSRP